MHHARFAVLGLLVAPASLAAQAPDSAVAPTAGCADCAAWNAPHPPTRLFGNTYYVGTDGLSAILVTSPRGHVLLDGALPESAPHVAASIRALGFRIEDVRLIVNSHPHFDHAGGIAWLQRASGAEVVASPRAAPVLRAGRSGPDDPQFGTLYGFPAVRVARTVADGDTVRVGPLALVAHRTAGHTPGGTTWSWRSCEGSGAAARCLDLVYADSQTPSAAPGFRYTASPTYPDALSDFARGRATLEALRCDVLVTPHPSASRLWERLAAGALVDPGACRRLAAAAREQLARRVADEHDAP